MLRNTLWRKNRASDPLKKVEKSGIRQNHRQVLRRNGRWMRLLLMWILLMVLMMSGWELRKQPVRKVTELRHSELKSFSDLVKERAINNQIVLTVSTNMFLNMTLNLLCSWERIGLTNYVVGALDHTTFEDLNNRGYPVYPVYKQSLLGGEELKSAEKRREDFHKVNLVKEEAIIWALSDGYEVVLTDTDLVWIHNPMVDLAKNYRQYDFAFQSASKEDLEVQELNGGFLYIKPTKASQVAMNLLVSTLTQDFSKNDQTEFRNILCLALKRTSNTTCHDDISGAKTTMLPRNKYAKGNLLPSDSSLSAVLKDPELFTLHFNGHGTSKKEYVMNKRGLWYLDENLNCVLRSSLWDKIMHIDRSHIN